MKVEKIQAKIATVGGVVWLAGLLADFLDI